MVAYFRVSRQSQGVEGLGMAAQKAAVDRHLEQNGCDLIASYSEVETGKRHDLANRPALRKAIAHAKRSHAILVVAKLDRLLRSTVIRSMLKTSGVRFQACDQPHANELTIDILAAVAEDEVRRISTRTKEALAAKKAQGVPLGSHRPECANNLSPAARARGSEIGAQRARVLAVEAYADIIDSMIEWREAGETLQQIADRLNDEGQTTRRGSAWTTTQVLRVLARAA